MEVGLSELAAVGVDREAAAELDVAVADEVLGLSLGAEAELLELVEDIGSEVVVEHRRLDVGRCEAEVCQS